MILMLAKWLVTATTTLGGNDDKDDDEGGDDDGYDGDEDDSDDEENKTGDPETTEGIIAKAKEEAKGVDEEEIKVLVSTSNKHSWSAELCVLWDICLLSQLNQNSRSRSNKRGSGRSSIDKSSL